MAEHIYILLICVFVISFLSGVCLLDDKNGIYPLDCGVFADNDFPIDIDNDHLYFIQSSHESTVHVLKDSQIPRSRRCSAK